MSLHEKSCECLKSELDLFAVPTTQTSILSGGYVEYNPVSSIGDGTPIEFDVCGSGQDYIDLANTQLYVKAKIVNHDNTIIADDAAVGPVNNFLHSLFSEVEVKLNGTLISSTNNTYPYRAYLENVLSYGQDAKDSQLQSCMYYKDVAGQMDILAVRGDNARNRGLSARAGFFAESATVEMLGRVHSDIFSQEKYLPSDIEMRLRLVRSKDAFCLMGAAGARFKVKITECKLFVRKVKLLSSVFNAHQKAFGLGNAKYALHRVVCKMFTVPMNAYDFTQEKVFSGQLPTRLVIACVDNDAVNGTYAKNPFNFKNFDLTSLKVYIDGQQQQIKPLSMNFTDNQYLNGYMSLFSGTGKLYKDEGLHISRTDFRGGYAMYAFDLTPDLADGDHFNLIKEGSVRVDMSFRAALPNTINIIVYGEFENILEIDGARNVVLDYGN